MYELPRDHIWFNDSIHTAQRGSNLHCAFIVITDKSICVIAEMVLQDHWIVF